MQIIIDIPTAEIPKNQDVVEIPLHFVNGKVCEAGGYDFEVLPKGHGRVVDVDVGLKYCTDPYEITYWNERVPAIVEADNG